MIFTIVSWGLTICVVGAAIYVYKPELFDGLKGQAEEVKSSVVEKVVPKPSKKSKTKKPAAPKPVGDESVDSGSGNQSGKKRKIIPTSVEKAVPLKTSDDKQQSSPRDGGDNLSDKDFAKQLAQAQSGTKLQVPQKQQASKKERRASKLGGANPSGASTEASSTAGRDADDDLTPAESSDTQSTDNFTTKAGDVSDMLEAPSAKPTTLRLTDVTNDSKQKKPANKAFEPVLSKKKRNEKQRKEEQRLAREESDRIHEAKKQEQLRRARLAAGTSNQTKANNFTATSNAWQSGTSNAVKSAPAADAQPLLDTFDPTASTAGPAYGAVHTQSSDMNSANELKATAGNDRAAAMTASASREGFVGTKRSEGVRHMTEHDQMQLLKEQEQEDAWESVTTKKSKRKGRQDNDSTSSATSPVRAAPISAKPKTNGSGNNNVAKKSEVNRFDTFQEKEKVASGLHDAEWEA